MDKISKNGRYTKITLEKMRIAKLGKKRSPLTDEWKKKLSIANGGSKSIRWKGGISNENKLARESYLYKDFRKKCFIRDGFQCQICKVVGGYLEVHHIKSFANHKELRFDVNNGVTLCKECHCEVDANRANFIKART